MTAPGNRRILFQPFPNYRLERIQFAGARALDRTLRRLGQILRHGTSAEMQMA